MFKSHRHPCGHCGAMTACTGDVVRNHDGFPALICLEYDAPGRIPTDFLCEVCDQKQQQFICEDCGVFGDEPHKSDCTEGMATPI